MNTYNSSNKFLVVIPVSQLTKKIFLVLKKQQFFLPAIITANINIKIFKKKQGETYIYIWKYIKEAKLIREQKI